MVHQVKDPALSWQWLGSLLWREFEPWPGELPHVVGMAKNEKINKTEIQPPKREEKNARSTPREESIHSVKTLRKESIKWD